MNLIDIFTQAEKEGVKAVQATYRKLMRRAIKTGEEAIEQVIDAIDERFRYYMDFNPEMAHIYDVLCQKADYHII